jgi:hypothetical protein
VYNIHLQRAGPGKKARYCQCSVLLAMIKDHLRGKLSNFATSSYVARSRLRYLVSEFGPNLPVCVIVGGTFNTIYEYREFELVMMREDGFKDTYRVLNKRRHKTREYNGTYHKFHGIYSSRDRKRDYIWVKLDTMDLSKFQQPGANKTQSIVRPTPPRYQLEINQCWINHFCVEEGDPPVRRYPSDHFPLLTKISLVQNRENEE